MSVVPGEPGLPPYIQILVKIVELGGDWFSNPFYTGEGHMAVWSAPYEIRKLEVHWSRTPTVGVVQDDDICTFHFLNITSGVPDASWTTTDYTTVENACDTFWDTIKPYYLAETKLSEYLWRADGPAFRPHGTSLSPTLRITSRSVPGGAATGSPLPPQCAMSVTEVTAAHFDVSGVGVPGSEPGTGRTQRRNRWGRFYLPAIAAVQLVDGRFPTTVTGVVSGATKDFYNTCVAAQIVPVMYSPTTGNSWSIDAVHVDDIVDVIRSRRYVVPMTRSPNTINSL